ncbi:very-short-patch-repair endonuclease [Allocatelliglobosispora scoriae]|uniref:Very-short-patch-repair endonuclease n=1 Tax=Allocatelliglobosispora scoriae TaxID=643052 RepID=A0A841BWS0_9ACTN|nr:hypothetical protein [Allocatelliglobosispora scoriae]MBB5871599.1 very-short-patch-repair endonuclease [Allocatelliglobosispora scoriae]
MPRRPAKPAALQRRVFRGADAIRAGLITRDQLRSSAWRTIFRDIYVERDATTSHRTRCIAALAYLLPPEAVITGRSAALVHGVDLMPDGDPVEVLMPTPFGPIAGVKVLFGRAAEDDIHRRADRLRLASPRRTCWDLAQHLDAVEAVVYVDAMIARGLVTRAELEDYAWSRSGEKGWRKMLTAAQLADPAAQSPQESRLRVNLVLRGLPRPVTQHVISRDGHFVARVDLAWPDLKIAVEYDGRWHGDPAQLDRDRARLNRILGADWLVLHVTAKRLRDDLDGFVTELSAAIAARRARSAR